MLHSLARHTVGVTMQLRLAVSDPPFDVNARVMCCRVPSSTLESGYLSGVQFLNLSTRQHLQTGQFLCAETQRQDGQANGAVRTRRRHPRIEVAPSILKTRGFAALELSESGAMLL